MRGLGLALVLRLVAPVDRREAFVVAAPERDAGVVAQAAHLVGALLADVREEVRMRRVRHAGEHHVVPEEDAETVALVVEEVALEVAAAPHADHVHVRRDGAAEQVAGALRGLVAGSRVARNPVRALREDGDAVHADREARAGLVRRAVDLDPAQSDPAIDPHRAGGNGERVERLLAVAVRPPEARPGDGERRLQLERPRRGGEASAQRARLAVEDDRRLDGRAGARARGRDEASRDDDAARAAAVRLVGPGGVE